MALGLEGIEESFEVGLFFTGEDKGLGCASMFEAVSNGRRRGLPALSGWCFFARSFGWLPVVVRMAYRDL